MDRHTLIDYLKTEIENRPEYFRLVLDDRIQFYAPDTLRRELLKFPIVVKHVDRVMNFGQWSGTFQVHSLSEALVARCLADGAEKAVNDLFSYLELDHNPCIEVCLLGGIIVNEEVELLPGVFISPLHMVPSSTLRSYLSEHNDRPDAPTSFSPRSAVEIDEKIPFPRAALYRRKEIRPKTFEGAKPLPSEAEWDDLAFLFRVADLLVLAGPSSPFARRQYTEMEDGCILKEHVGLSWAKPYEETRVDTLTLLTREMLTEFIPFLKKAVAGEKRIRGLIEVPIHRLNEAIRHKRLTDKAIDLGIALESLLLSSDSDRAQLSYQLRHRGAWLIGRDIQERKSIISLLNKIYTLRSKAVHKGSSTQIQKDPDGTKKLLDEGIVLCANAIKAVIDLDGDVQWEDLILGGSPRKADGGAPPPKSHSGGAINAS